MKNLLFFLWVLLAPIVEDLANYIVWQAKQKPMPEDAYEGTAYAYFLFYVFIAALLYER